MNKRIRILIADDHNMVRKGLIVLLEGEDDLEVVGEAQDGEAAVDQCRQHKPDVVLMDIKMPRMNGLEATKEILANYPGTKVVMLTSYKEDDNVDGALQAGAISYLMKHVSGKELADTIRRAYEGEPTLSPEAAQVLIKAAVSPPQPGHDLTDREQEVLALMIEGLSNNEIADRLFISGSTVKNHVSSILAKMGTNTRTRAVAIALENDVLEDTSTQSTAE